MATVQSPTITAEEFLRLPDPGDGNKLELVRGEIIAKPLQGLEHGELQGTIASLIKQFFKANPIGRVLVESGLITERNPDTVRGPDVSYYSKERLPLGQRVVGYHDQPADVCVEVVSPSNSFRQLQDKAKEYLFVACEPCGS